jgi:MFS family permease
MSDRRASLRRVLANRRLRRLELAFLGFVAAEYGVWTAVLVYAYEQGGATRAGLVAAIQLLPAAAVAPIAARYVDSHGGGAVLRLGYLAQAVSLSLTAVLMLLDLAPASVYAGAIIAASAVTTTRPAQNALLPALVTEPADLTAANAVTGWVESLSILIGPALTGVAIAIDGPGAAVAVFAVAMSAATIVASPLRDAHQAVADGAPAQDGAEAADAASVSGVTATLRLDGRVTALLGLGGVQFVALGALDVLEVVLATGVLGLGPAGAGYLGAAYGAGSMVGAAGSLALVGRRHLTAVALVAAAASGAAFLVLGLWPTVVGAFALLAGFGTGHAVLDVAGRTILHRVVPVSVRGRLFGILEGLSMLGLAVGSLSVPLLVNAGGVEAALLAVAGLLLVAAVLAAPARRSAERAGPAHETELDVLRRSLLFGVLSAPVLEDLAGALRREAVAAGQVVVREGEWGELFYLVAEGGCDVTIAGEHVRTVLPGDGFGEVALLRDRIRIATVTATVPSTLFALARDPFLQAVTGSAHARRAVVEMVDARLPTT